MKRWLAILALCLLALSVPGVYADQNLGAAGDSGVITEAPQNQDYIAYENNFQPFEWLKQVLSKEKFGYIPEPTDTSHLKGKKVSKKALEAEVRGIASVPAGGSGEIVSAPSMYNLSALGRVSPVKNQGSCGSCWAFASYGSMESEALPGQLFDLSENNLKNTHGFDPAPCSGGNALMTMAYLSRWSGAVAESDDPYVASSTTSPSGLPIEEFTTEVLMIPGRSGALDNDNIKAALQTTGALYTTIYYSDSSYNPATKAYYYSGTSGSNHAVTIVGWDDTYSRNNFLPATPGDGAFIVKNSWGTSWGDKGYFFISYYDAKVGKSLTAFTGESATDYAHIYQYDPLGWTSSMGYGSDTAWAANVFTATSTETVSAVGLTTNQVNTAYQIFIYTRPDQGPLNSAGPVSTVQGTIGIPGYHTITLSTPVTVNTGEKFSIVVKVQTPNYNYPIAIETPVSGYSSKATAEAGQSFISRTGTTWSDLTTSIPNANVCVKAFTVNTGTPAAPVAAFSGTPTSGNAPLPVVFTDASSNSPTSWLWAFGDGGTTSLQNPSHTYTAPGTYTVTLTATNAGGSNTMTRTDYITVTAAAPVVQLSGKPTTGTAPLTVVFTDESTNSPTSWLWAFGDGATSTLQNPSHTYTAPGTYTVTLTATNAGGSNTKTIASYIKISAAPVAPIAGFTGTPTSGVAPLTVTFSDTSANSPTSWAWTFGDGGTSSLQNPSHTYNSAGTYTVALTATNAGGSNTITQAGYITVTAAPAPLKASFTASPVSGQPPLIVKFEDTSTGDPKQWAWNFGDRSTATEQNPQHTYTKAGSYTVTFMVKDSIGGTSKVIMKRLITIQAASGGQKSYISVS